MNRAHAHFNRLANKGLLISESGVSVKTSMRFDRYDYVDATRLSVLFFPSLSRQSHRGFIKATSAASFGLADPDASGPYPTNTTPTSTTSLNKTSFTPC